MATASPSTDQDLDAALKQHFGFDDFRPGQREVIEYLLSGKSAAALFPTGGGKSLCYQLPALLLPGVTLVVSPLIALMKDQIDALRLRGIAAARLDSSLSLEEYRDVMAAVRNGELRLLYVAPERFNNERFRESIRNVRISLFAVDEAHCISEWGHNFRPDYLKLAAFATQCGAERSFALTATATPSVLEDICREFHVEPDCAVRTGFYRANLTLLTTAVTDGNRDQILEQRLIERPAGPSIVYVTLQQTAEKVANQLAATGLSAKHYHAGMKGPERTAVQDWFLTSDDGIVVATIAFGMGIDKPNIRYIYHYNPPKSLENYSQEIGRAGRDDLPSTCEFLFCRNDLNVLQNFIFGDTPSFKSVHGMVEDVFSGDEEFDLSIYDTAHQHDIRDLVVRTLLTYLELDGYLEGGTPLYANYQFKPLMRSADILANFEGERREFLAAVFRYSKVGRTWFTIDLESVAVKLNSPRGRIVRALDYLAQLKMLEVKAAGVRHRYSVTKMPPDLAELSQDLFNRMQIREETQLKRLDQVVDFVRLDSCQTSALSAYFGEPLEDACGHCSWCLAENNTPPVHHETDQNGPDRENEIDETIWQKAIGLRNQHAKLLGKPQVFARLLCGISSPKLIRAKLTRDPLFGALESVPFSRVLNRAQE